MQNDGMAGGMEWTARRKRRDERIIHVKGLGGRSIVT